MAEQIDRAPIDKSTWGDGPWQTEPDRVEWVHAGLPCLALRNRLGNWCGYAAVPPGHALHGKHYDDVDVDAHGGLTYSDGCDGARICHVPAPGEPADVWWFGFDCAHLGDISPGMDAYARLRGRPPLRFTEDSYKDLAYVQAETNSLAKQLAEVQ